MKARILIVDIETFPNVSYTWGKWDQNVIKFVKEWELASFAYKWLDETSTRVMSRKDYSERVLVSALHRLLDEADVIIAHNGDEFDIKKIKTKLLQFGLKRPSLFKTVDTKKIAKQQFAFNSNSLNDLGEYLGLGKKVDTGGFSLWEGCMAGDKASWALMEKYNKQDVDLLEKVYYKLRAWTNNHPNIALMEDRVGCPTCGSSKVQKRGTYVKVKTKQQRYQCLDCGHWYTGKLVKP